MIHKYALGIIITLSFNFWNSLLVSQNEYAKWYFGNNAALDFLTSPPTPLLNSALFAPFFCATMSSPSGNLLFYTNGQTIRNSSHLLMANGTGLHGYGICQSVLALRKPGSSNLYYIFTIGDPGGWPKLKYSIIDMSLAAGQGSVIAKNVVVSTQTVTTQMHGTYHCNGKDMWIVTHELGTNIFRSYLLTSAGLNTTAVVSSIGLNHPEDWDGPMKISSSGNKLAVCVGGTPNTFRAVELFDFNSSSGIITNSLAVYTESIGVNVLEYFMGIEFSPDNSKLYVAGNMSNAIFQFDICAGSASAIQASKYNLNPPNNFQQGLQLAQNGKIYTSNGGGPPGSPLHVINSPNNSGAACNFVPYSQSLSGQQSGQALPNFFLPFRHSLTPNNFTYSVTPSSGCHAITFTSNTPTVSCAASNFSVNSVKWDFGDPSSGSKNNSTIINPMHVYPAAGNYTVIQVLYFACSSDTIRKVITVPPPYLNVTSKPGCGAGSGSATVSATGGVGPYTYTWLPTMINGPQAINLNSGTFTVLVFDQSLSCKASTTLAINNYSAPPVSVQPSSMVTLCAGSQSLVTLQNYSGSYNWSPSAGLSSAGNGTIQVSSQVSQVYTITISTSSCSSTTFLNVQVKALPSVSVSAEKTVACENSTISLIGLGGVNYIWKFSENNFAFGPFVSTPVIPQWGNLATYTLIGTDANGCSNTAMQTVSVLPAPRGFLVLPKESVCAPASGSFLFVATSPTGNVSSIWTTNGQSSAGMAIYNFLYPGVYTFTGTLTDINNSCKSDIYSTITVYQKPRADFTYIPSEIRAELDEVLFTSSSNSFGKSSEFSWFLMQGNRKYSLEGDHTSFLFEEEGIFPVALVMKDENGCSDTITKPITVIPGMGIYIPNSFTPNEDGLNEIFKPIVTGSKKYKLCVYDRWGATIFETEETGTGWDGTFKGEPCKSDIYTWTLQSTSVSGTVSKTGSVLLLR